MIRVYFAAFCLLLLAGCGGGSNNSGSLGETGGSGNSGSSQVSISISPTSATLPAGATQAFQATVTGSSNTAVQWTVNAVAGGTAATGTISTAGIYTAPATLTAATQFTITAISAVDSTKTANAVVTVNPPPPPPVVTVSVSPTGATIAVNATAQFTAAVQGTTNTGVTWSVDGVTGGNSSTGTVSAAGLYTAPGTAGSHTVTATSVADATKSASATVAVVNLSISPTAVTLAVSTTQQFTAAIQGTSNAGVIWSVDGIASGNSSVGTVTSGGLYTAPATAGTHVVTATSVAVPNLSASATVSVISLSVSPATATVTEKGTQQFKATVLGVSNTGVTWSVDGVVGGNNTTGTISTTGLYTAPTATGQHTITAAAVVLPTCTANAAVRVIASQGGSVPVLTYHNDDTRQGANVSETILNTGNVNSQQFGKLYSYPVDGQVYGQPLYVPNLTIGGVTHNVVFVVTENDSVYAFDANGLSSNPLWHVQLGQPQSVNDSEGIRPLLGITSTPVIDSISGTMYVLAENSGDVFKLHALDITTGNERFGGPVVVTATVNGTGWDSVNGKITLEAGCYQRDGLALNAASNGINIAFAHCNHGWLLEYDKVSLQQTAVLNLTPDGAGGGLWGGAPAIDDNDGSLYTISGVDVNDPISNGYNDAFLRLSSDLSVSDYFIPADAAYLVEHDSDLGAGGAILMPDNSSDTPHEVVGGGKDGRVFVVNRDNMGQQQTTDHVVETVQTGTSQLDNIFSTPAFWNGNIYYHSNHDVVKAYSWSGVTGLMSTEPISQGSINISTHGATVSISANGSSDGIAWEIDNSKFGAGGPSVLRAYDANNLANELYDSEQNVTRDTAGTALKFTVPTIADGQVFVGTSTELDIYGLLQQ